MITINAAARLRATTSVVADWFDAATPAYQAKYLKTHPNSSRAKGLGKGLDAAKKFTKDAENNHKQAKLNYDTGFSKKNDTSVEQDAKNYALERQAYKAHQDAEHAELAEENLSNLYKNYPHMGMFKQD